MRIGLVLPISAALVTLATPSFAADPAFGAAIHSSDRVVEGVDVMVDELFLRSGGCPTNPRCIAPRVLPIASSFWTTRVGVPVLVTLPPPPQNVRFRRPLKS